MALVHVFINCVWHGLLILLFCKEQFVEFGGILHDREKVLDIEPGTVVSIKTVNNTYKARSVVITVGKILEDFYYEKYF